MKNKSLYEKTVNILVDAYFNDTLEHDSCQACAVGNLVAAGMGFSYEGRLWSHATHVRTDNWSEVLWTGNESRERRLNMSRYTGEIKKQIDSTGYTVGELSDIEHAFETAPKGKSADDWMYNGLMAVVEVLQQIHECSEEETTVAKERFKKEECAVS